MGRAKLYQSHWAPEKLDQFMLPTGNYQMIHNQLNQLDPAAVEQWVEDHYLEAEDWILELVEDYLKEKKAANWHWISGSVPAGATRASRKPYKRRSNAGT